MINPAPGILLIADPFLKDPSFIRTVVFLCEHRDQGSFGFVLNKQVKPRLDELIPELEGCSWPVYFGGPVQQDTLHFLHQYPDLIPDAIPVGEGIYWGGDFETVTALLKEKLIQPDKIKFFLGYSGWGDGQLNEEMEEKSWLTVSANRKLVFNTLHSEIWKGSLKELGGDYEMMINFPIDPQLN
ncbi:MAG: YqgE/AlgH family protein [Chitinophagaceae bacterium]|nr:YqgE/AlgH family protein [Chitinophagaceae bacterium]